MAQCPGKEQKKVQSSPIPNEANEKVTDVSSPPPIMTVEAITLESFNGTQLSEGPAEPPASATAIKSSVVDLSIEAASKIIEKNLDSEDNRRLVDQTLDSMGQA